MTSRTLYHGTGIDSWDGIDRDGIFAFRQSGMVFLTPYPKLARRYAAARAIGLFAAGRATELNGVVVTADVPADLLRRSNTSTADRCVEGHLPRRYITRIERFDVSALNADPAFRWRRLREFAGLIDWVQDDLTVKPDQCDDLLARVEAAAEEARQAHYRATGHLLDDWRDIFDEGEWSDHHVHRDGI
jgi:hypothetical protein